MALTFPLSLAALIVMTIAIETTHASRYEDQNDYERARSRIIEEEFSMALGGSIEFNDNEEIANNYLMQLKYKEVDDGFVNPQYFNLSKHFFHFKHAISESRVYHIIKTMPKGAALHVHDTALLGPDYLLNITYMDHLYICYAGERIQLIFSSEIPTTDNCLWQLLRDVRYSSGNVKKFDQKLRKHFTIVVDNPEVVDQDINAVWSRLMNVFITITPMLCYKPVWESYYYDALKTFRDDNIMYIEVRSTLPELYDLDGTTYDSIETARVYEKTTRRFVADHPDFIGAKLIYAPLRKVSNRQVQEYVGTARNLKKKMPDFFAGFDLVGQEDLGYPLAEFVPELLNKHLEFDLFFHAGETDWYGCPTDFNLIDAILLGAKRLGHAYALLKHPKLLEMAVEKKIAIEVNVISNQVLKLVDDLRDHPLAAYLARDLPIVISSDDPGLWEADPLSQDMYVAFVAVASRHADLRLLKQLALNSLSYSAMSSNQKYVALSRFEERWAKFVDKIQLDFAPSVINQ